MIQPIRAGWNAIQWRRQDGWGPCGICKLVAIMLIHRDPAHAWTLASLASVVAMSRSAFAARFVALVGIYQRLNFCSAQSPLGEALFLHAERRAIAPLTEL